MTSIRYEYSTDQIAAIKAWLAEFYGADRTWSDDTAAFAQYLDCITVISPHAIPNAIVIKQV